MKPLDFTSLQTASCKDKVYFTVYKTQFDVYSMFFRKYFTRIKIK